MIIIFREEVLLIEPKEALIMMMFPVGYFLGGKIGVNYNKRKKKRLENTIS